MGLAEEKQPVRCGFIQAIIVVNFKLLRYSIYEIRQA
jgi:hypothetical protein